MRLFGVAVSMFLLVCTGCSNTQTSVRSSRPTLEDYATMLPGASKPGPNASRFVTRLTDKGSPPDERLSVLYADVMRRWRYVPDPEGEDEFSNAEVLFASGDLHGDCEDCCAVLVAICRVLDLTCRVCLGQTGKRGHAWVEVLIGKDRDVDDHFRRRLLKRFGETASLTTRRDGHWLQLSPQGTLTEYKATHAITISGELVPLGDE